MEPGTKFWKAIHFKSSCLLRQIIQHGLPMQSYGKKWTHNGVVSTKVGTAEILNEVLCAVPAHLFSKWWGKKRKECTREPQKQFEGYRKCFKSNNLER